MADQTLYCGIDMPADSFDICYLRSDGELVFSKLPNTIAGFKELLKLCPGAYRFAMEATGASHLPLCFFLHEKKCTYSAVDALQIKRYIQMQLERNKTDRKDARHTCMYGIERKPEQYKMPGQEYFECRTLNNAIETLTAGIASCTNKIYAAKKLKIDSAAAVKSYQQIIKTLSNEMKKLQAELDQKLTGWQPELVAQVKSVKGIGKRAAATLIVFTQAFKHTASYQQLTSYAGLSPKEYTSGKSIKGRVRISKIGGKQLRHILYMAALNAKKTNPACKALFDRLVEKGKNKKTCGYSCLQQTSKTSIWSGKIRRAIQR